MLDGVRVLDLTTVLMGPFATQILGDLGADVIKIEAPEGDIVRRYQPARSPGMPGIFLNLHRNKRSIVLDLKSPDDATTLKRLIATADVLIHNIRGRAMDRLGFGPDAVRTLNPRLIYCMANGFRQDGPYAAKAAYDDVIQAGAGLTEMIGRIGGTPEYVPTALCDKVAGMTIAWSVLAALYHRERTGEAQVVEVPMYETNIAFNLVEHVAGWALVPPVGDAGFARYMTRNRRPYRTRDGHVCILPYTEKNWRDFFDGIGRPDVLQDARFTDFTNRIRNIDALYAILANCALERTTADWVAYCDGISIPAMPVNRFEDLWDDPHLREVGFFEEVEHPTEGRYSHIAMPVRFSAANTDLRRPAPHLGEHTAEILDELDRSREIAPAD
ncbi:CaiB/BaiF CoA transferase family protein [Pinisolibacter aquiterrae]|uniref:CaiB/BaiF CoA transferase family protein n=1 Tax=Pinisolibacter aquiterrae TaxID=2815579 RepID=UPI001C3DC228|nr:CoA transferase [Pinisolibacter aquiterrae]MBV5266878.1 CoA transferase [Pinisolibacter aquiterrae]MCC8234811.1 CoA transferase [Pinisolibacter aquiterrae]